MVLSRTFEPPDLVVATVTGRMTPRDQAALVGFVRDSLQFARELRVLVVWDGFGGWTPDALFNDPACWLQDRDRVARMAIVGAAEGRDAMLAFIAQPLRRMPIEYFETEADARRWLAASATPPGGYGADGRTPQRHDRDWSEE